MKILLLPFFTLKLAGRLGLTFVQLAFARFLRSKQFWLAGGLTLLLVGSTIAYQALPNSPITSPEPLSISLENSLQETRFITFSTSALDENKAVYEAYIATQPFVAQHDYLNLAVLANSADQRTEALQLLELARSIDPNREFFSE